MPIDISQSRRDYNHLCRWWVRDERDQFTSDELVYKRTPSGGFWAKEVSPEQLRNNVIGGTFMFDSSHVTIKSPDNLFALQEETAKNECLVEYDGELWIVVSIQKSKHKRGNTMFASDKNCSHFWYIELRK